MMEKKGPLTNREKIDAIVWAAAQAEMSYGKFVQNLSNAEKLTIYRNYRRHLGKTMRATATQCE